MGSGMYVEPNRFNDRSASSVDAGSVAASVNTSRLSHFLQCSLDLKTPQPRNPDLLAQAHAVDGSSAGQKNTLGSSIRVPSRKYWRSWLYSVDGSSGTPSHDREAFEGTFIGPLEEMGVPIATFASACMHACMRACVLGEKSTHPRYYHIGQFTVVVVVIIINQRKGAIHPIHSWPRPSRLGPPSRTLSRSRKADEPTHSTSIRVLVLAFPPRCPRLHPLKQPSVAHLQLDGGTQQTEAGRALASLHYVLPCLGGLQVPRYVAQACWVTPTCTASAGAILIQLRTKGPPASLRKFEQIIDHLFISRGVVSVPPSSPLDFINTPARNRCFSFSHLLILCQSIPDQVCCHGLSVAYPTLTSRPSTVNICASASPTATTMEHSHGDMNMPMPGHGGHEGHEMPAMCSMNVGRPCARPISVTPTPTVLDIITITIIIIMAWIAVGANGTWPLLSDALHLGHHEPVHHLLVLAHPVHRRSSLQPPRRRPHRHGLRGPPRRYSPLRGRHAQKDGHHSE